MVDKKQKRFFPKPPNWEDVEEKVIEIGELLDKEKISYTEKFIILDLLQKMYEREFQNMSLIAFLDSSNRAAAELDKAQTEHIYG